MPYVPLRFYLQNFDSLTPVKSSYSDGKYSYDYRLNGKYALDIYRGLKSSSNTEYVKALHQLIVSVYGDGHTAMTPPKVNSIEGLKNYKLETEKYSGTSSGTSSSAGLTPA